MTRGRFTEPVELVIGPVEEATRSDLLSRGVRADGNALAALAVHLAHAVDDAPDERACAALARELRAVMVEVAKEAPAVPARDVVDELRSRRASRRNNS